MAVLPTWNEPMKRIFLLIIASLAAASPSAEAIEKSIPKPAEVRALSIQPAKLALKGADGAQLLVTGELAAGRLHDLSAHAVYESADATIVRVSSSGRVTPLKDGQATITIRFGDKTASVPITVTAFSDNPPINFAN